MHLTNAWLADKLSEHGLVPFQIKKTSEATLTTIQDMVTIEDYDVSECFHHSRSTESVKSTVSETYLSKPSIAKRRANQQETEQFYFMVNSCHFKFFYFPAASKKVMQKRIIGYTLE